MGLLRMAARTAVVAGTASATAGAVQHRQQQRYAAQDQAAYQQQVAAQQAAYAQQAPPAPAPAAPAAEDPMVQIQKLGALKEQGLLSDEEFAAAKARILGL